MSEKFILNGVLQGLVDLGNWLLQIIDYLNPLSDKFILKSIIEFFIEIISYINPFSENFIGYKIIELLGDLLQFLFIPSEDSFDRVVEVWKSHFLFIDTIKVSIDSIKNSIFNSLPFEKSLSFGVDTPIYKGDIEINFGWFEKFKPYTDLLLTGFVYLFFVWRLYSNLPNIISGISVSNGGGGHNN